MKAAFLDEADPEAVSHAVRHVLEEKGALVTEHRHSRVRFEGSPPLAPPAWKRQGYVGIYQRVGEKDVEVRLVLRARWPWRILVTVALVNVLVTVATILVNPPGTVWFLFAFLGGFALLVAILLHVNTLKHVRIEERQLMDAFEEAFRAGLADAHVLDLEEKRLADAEAQLEAELTRRRLDRDRADEPRPARTKPRFSLRPGRKAPPAPEAGEVAPAEAGDVAAASDAELEARRAALLARKAEIEARRREGS